MLTYNKTTAIYGAIAALTITIFVFDCLTPLGVAVWILYLAPVALCLFVRDAAAPLISALISTLFIAGGFFLSSGTPTMSVPVVLMNRAFAILTIWSVGAMAFMYVRSRTRLERLTRFQHAQVQVAMQIRGATTPSTLGASVLRVLTTLTDAQVGAIYVRDEDLLRRIATWALPEPDAAPAIIPLGAGLIGQAAREGRTLKIVDAPPGYLHIGSALGDGHPSQIFVTPLTADGVVVGALELGFASGQRPLDETEQLVEGVAESIGMALRSASYRARLEKLLEETQRQSEQLQVQQEELRVTNEELQEQSRALMDSQASLETQHAELEQKNVLLEGYAHRLEAQKTELLVVQQAQEVNAIRLEDASRYKSEFLANMSHELRTPLNSSLILAQLLERNKDGNLTSEQVRYAATIHASNNALLVLINDILDLSKVEAGQIAIECEPVAIDALMLSLQQTFAPIAQEKGLDFRVDRTAGVPDVMITDNQRVEQILRNLVANAMKFTEHGEVRLVVERVDETLRFDVHDSGIGIAADKLELIFEAFQQADGTTSRRFGGSGLGLSISREFSRLLGGRISVASEEGVGSVFSLTLPVCFTPAARAAAAVDATRPTPSASPTPAAEKGGLAGAVPRLQVSVSAGQSRGELPESLSTSVTADSIPDDRNHRQRGERLILAIEDDAAFAAILRDLAHDLNFDFVHATNAASGLALARETQPAGILLDIGLPDRSGLTVLEWLKQDSLTRHLPIHIVSATDHAERARFLGAVGYTLKPTARETLEAALLQLETRLEQPMRRVLVVEDDAVMSESIRTLLETDKTEIVLSSTLGDALRQMETSRFDCIVTDLALPDGTGYDLLEQLAANLSWVTVPVIVYTGRVLSDDEEQRLRRYSKSIIIKGARSPERLLDEVTLFLHSVESSLPPEQQRMLRAVRQRDREFEGRTILLAEDDVRNIFALSHVIEPLGAALRIARNGLEALQALEREPDIDLVLMDVMMPEMDGLSATREIRRSDRFGRVPVIALTAKAMADDRQRCLEAGADDYISKPIDVEKMIALCRVWLQQR
ncbi:response regulator [Paraburkholderia sp. BCC1884]|uniref:hybrid sensor histidine kinase/response regulator n=1 Tax=Paraburkholderia sp. BCC1884 TaxID=2562668 RepID=UPI00118451BF|nr:response regulator [Paraburkholderia sp. BCC1884]